MRIGDLAQRLGTTAHAVRFYERRGLLPGPLRADNGYRDYSEVDAQRLRLLIGLRHLDLPLQQAADIAALCAEDRCGEVSTELHAALTSKRAELRRRIEDMTYLDRHLAHLQGDLAAGEPPRELITLGKEDRHGDAMR